MAMLVVFAINYLRLLVFVRNLDCFPPMLSLQCCRNCNGSEGERTGADRVRIHKDNLQVGCINCHSGTILVLVHGQFQPPAKLSIVNQFSVIDSIHWSFQVS